MLGEPVVPHIAGEDAIARPPDSPPLNQGVQGGRRTRAGGRAASEGALSMAHFLPWVSAGGPGKVAEGPHRTPGDPVALAAPRAHSQSKARSQRLLANVEQSYEVVTWGR